MRNVLFMPFYLYLPQFYTGIARYACTHDWHLNADGMRIGKIPYGWKGDGIVTLLANRMDAKLVLQYGVPIVDMGMIRTEVPLPRVSKDNMMIGQMAARYFLKQGWKNFAFFSWTHDNARQMRLTGFQQELERYTLFCRDMTFQPYDPMENDDWDGIHQWLTQELVLAPKPLAVLAYNDFEAALVVDVCLANGLQIPGDVGLLGVDNIESICLYQKIPISSIRSEAETVGYRAAQLLDELMDGATPPEEPIFIPPAGIEPRQSTNHLLIRNPRLKESIKVIDQRLADPSLSMDMIAETVGLSRIGLYYIFQHELHQTPVHFLKKKRIARARDLLLNSQDSIAEIACGCGMPVLSTFIRQFILETGMKPGKWRRIMKGNPIHY